MKKTDFDLEEAKVIVKRIKEKYKFGTKDCPEWMVGIAPSLQQDGNYAISICIPMFPRTIGDENINQFLDGFEGMRIHLRGVGERNFGGKPPEIKKDENQQQELAITPNKISIKGEAAIQKPIEPIEAKKIPNRQMVKRGIII